MKIGDERPADELQGEDAFAALERGIRQLQPAFHLVGHVKALTLQKAPRGVFVDVVFRKGSVMPVDRVRILVSSAQARSLRHHLDRVLDA